MAYVDGSPVYMADLYELLIHAEGLKMAQQLIVSEAVRQAATAKGLTVTPQEVQAEHDGTLARMWPSDTAPAQRERLLDQLMERRGIPQQQWRLSMERNALLGKLAGDEVQVTDEEIRDVHESRYGRKVVVRHIQSANTSEAQQAMKKLRAGEDFA